MSDTILERLTAIEERLNKLQTLVEQTPLNDGMQKAIQLALQEGQWFADMLEEVVETFAESR